MNDTNKFIDEVLSDLNEGSIGTKSALVRLRLRAGWSLQKTMKVLGVGEKMAKDWLSPSGSTMPTMDDVERFAAAFRAEVVVADEDDGPSAPSMRRVPVAQKDFFA